MDILEFLEKNKQIMDNVMKKYLPEKFDSEYIEWAFGKPKYAFDTESLTKSLAEPCWDLLNRGGKRWRPGLLLLVTDILKGDRETAKEIAGMIELIHNGTLLVDDVEDLGKMRRGKPCIHILYGQDVAINAGNFLYFIPLLILIKNKERLGKDKLVKLYEIYAEEMINLSLGQAMDIWWHKGGKQEITEEEYFQMCSCKTGTLARMSTRMAAVISDRQDLEEKLARLAESIGIGFQIQDDVLSVTGEEFSKKKGFGDDITEGKRSLMVIYALRHASPEQKKRLLEILGMHTTNKELIQEAIQILKSAEAVEYAKKKAREIVRDAWENIDGDLPDCEPKDILRNFINFLIERKI